MIRVVDEKRWNGHCQVLPRLAKLLSAAGVLEIFLRASMEDEGGVLDFGACCESVTLAFEELPYSSSSPVLILDSNQTIGRAASTPTCPLILILSPSASKRKTPQKERIDVFPMHDLCSL